MKKQKLSLKQVKISSFTTSISQAAQAQNMGGTNCTLCHFDCDPNCGGGGGNTNNCSGAQSGTFLNFSCQIPC